MLTKEQLGEIEARVNAAVPGPWEYYYYAGTNMCYITSTWNGSSVADGEGVFTLNAPFIAHARQDVPDLLAEIKRLQADNKKLREALKPFARGFFYCYRINQGVGSPYNYIDQNHYKNAAQIFSAEKSNAVEDILERLRFCLFDVSAETEAQ